MSSPPETSPRLFRRVLKIVLLLVGLSIILLIFLSRSESFAREAFIFAVDRAGVDGQLKLEHSGFSGSIADGISLESLRVVKRKPPFEAELASVSLKINFERLFTAGVLSLSGQIGQVEVDGLAAPPAIFEKIPAWNGLACFAGIPANIEVASFSVGTITLKPWTSSHALVKVDGICIKPGGNAGEHQVDALAAASWKNRQIASATFSGLLKQKQQRLDGSVIVCFAGQRLSSEVCVMQKRRKVELSGYIASAAIDLAPLSLWLSPVWQEKFPFGFDGRLDGSGSWLFNEEVGFLGNLAGKYENLRAVALGLYFTVFEFNGSWKFFDGNLGLNDSGSFFAGFPAVLSGQVEGVAKSTRKWDLNFVCSSVDFSELAGRLPWGLKYSLKLPELIGTAAMSMTLTGSRVPDMAGKAVLAGLKIGKGHDERLLAGRVDYLQTGLASASIEMNFAATSENSVLPVFKRFKGRGGSLYQGFALHGLPQTFTWSLKGPPNHDQRFSGSLAAGDKHLASFDGLWHAGFGHMLTSGSATETAGYRSDSIPYLDLFLAR